VIVVTANLLRRNPHPDDQQAGYLDSRARYVRDKVLHPELMWMMQPGVSKESLRKIDEGTAFYIDYVRVQSWLERYGSTDERIVYAEKAITRFPADPRCYALLAQVYIDVGNTTAAIQTMGRCVHRRWDYYYWHGTICELLEDQDRALVSYRKALELFAERGETSPILSPMLSDLATTRVQEILNKAVSRFEADGNR
jgi:tetratricopeptide (TPR) repeat protein